MKRRTARRSNRVLIALVLAIASTFLFVTPTTAATYQSPYYSLTENGISFIGSHKLTYVAYSNRLDVSRSDLYIDVLTCCGSSGKKFYCSYCKYERNSPWPHSGFVQDDNVPAEFYYENTPNWANVNLSPIGDFYWGGSVVKFNHRTVSVGGYCNDPITFFGEYAGVQLMYSPSTGWGQIPYSS